MKLGLCLALLLFCALYVDASKRSTEEVDSKESIENSPEDKNSRENSREDKNSRENSKEDIKSDENSKESNSQEDNSKDSNESNDDINVPYTIWVGNDVVKQRNTVVRIDEGESFYNVMKKAARRDSNYKFEAITYSFGRYITAIGGVKENKEKKQHWTLYVLNKRPNKGDKPTDAQLTPVGVDDLKVKRSEFYLFWYKTFDY